MKEELTFEDVCAYIDQLVEKNDETTIRKVIDEAQSGIGRIFDNRMKAIEEKKEKKFLLIVDSFAPLAECLESGAEIDEYSSNIAVREVAREYFYGNDDLTPPFVNRTFGKGKPVDYDCMVYAVDILRKATKHPRLCVYWQTSVCYSDEGTKHLKSLFEFMYTVMDNACTCYRSKKQRYEDAN